MRFSQRMGKTPIPKVIQMDGMTDDLRAGLWNVLLVEGFGETVFPYVPNQVKPKIDQFSSALWADFFKLPVDDRPNFIEVLVEKIRGYFFDCRWFEAYDFTEFCVKYYGEGYAERVNQILERELSGFRVIDGKLAPISSTEEVAAIQHAISDETFPGASTHLKTALDLLSNKTNPDYRNSIKESISAVESMSCALTESKSATLGAALEELAKTHPLHGALKEGFKKLYGYASDKDGIRHALLEESTLTQADAVYFLVSCSAFVNYLKVKSSK